MQADESLALSSHYLKNLISIVSPLLQTGVESSCPDAVEATWVLSLALKGLYSILKVTHAYYHTHTKHAHGHLKLVLAVTDTSNCFHA